MRTILYSVLVLTLLLAPQSVRSVVAQSLPEKSVVLGNMAEAAKALKYLEASVRQVRRETSGLRLREESTGSIAYKAGPEGKERARVQYTEPIPQTVWVDGDRVVIYQPKATQAIVTTRRQGAQRHQSLGVLNLGYGQAVGELEAEYKVTVLGRETLGGAQTVILQFDPRDGSDRSFLSAHVWVDTATWLPMQYHLFERGAQTTVTLSNIRINKKIPDSSFEIRYPKETSIVEG